MIFKLVKESVLKITSMVLNLNILIEKGSLAIVMGRESVRV